MALHPRTVDEIFGRMLVRYGATWIRMWEGVDIAPVKTDWANTLDGISFFAIQYGLNHLPERYPPDAGQFRALCCQAPIQPAKQLPAPKFDPAKAREQGRALAAKVKTLFKPKEDRFLWARRLQEREKAGDDLTLQQRIDWREALKTHDEMVTFGSGSTIPKDVLPPDMRLPVDSQKNGACQ